MIVSTIKNKKLVNNLANICLIFFIPLVFMVFNILSLTKYKNYIYLKGQGFDLITKNHLRGDSTLLGAVIKGIYKQNKKISFILPDPIIPKVKKIVVSLELFQYMQYFTYNLPLKYEKYDAFLKESEIKDLQQSLKYKGQSNSLKFWTSKKLTTNGVEQEAKLYFFKNSVIILGE